MAEFSRKTSGFLHWGAVLVACLFFSVSCEAPRDDDLDPAALGRIETAVEAAIEEGQIPGAVVWIEHGEALFTRAYGNRSLEPEPRPMKLNTIFDVASLTKVMATAPSIMLLIERELCSLDAPVSTYLPEFVGEGREAISLRHLLTHTSGLRPGLSPKVKNEGGQQVEWSGYKKGIELATRETPRSRPGSKFVYSDINFILLGEIVQRVSGRRLNEFARDELYVPLQMTDTGFLPEEADPDRIAPTQRVGDTVLHGQVHDPTSRKMGGVTGHAGLFTTAADLARYARMLLNRGTLEGTVLMKPETVQLMTQVQSPARLSSWRGLGWDIDSGYSGHRGEIFPVGGFGHTGWTGPSIWVDPFSQSLVIFMANRVHPDGKGNVLPLRARLGTLAAEAILDFKLSPVPASLKRIRNGIDVLVDQEFEPLKGLKVGLITNHTGMDARGTSSIDLLHQASEVELVSLFSPEHGIRGDRDARISDERDAQTGLPVFSLYGESRKPSLEQLDGLEALVFDIQDIGCRFYTYISTMGLAMEAAATAGIPFFVLDRVNPIGGERVEGPLRRGETHFTAYHEIPVRHGMTVGELALMIRSERNLDLDLNIIPVANWSRDLMFDETGLQWINPSPNMRSLTQALLYPGIGLLETTELSVGRGTDTPFEVIGAPYIHGRELAAELNRLGLPGVGFVPIRFTPDASKYAGELCQGVNLILKDRDACRVVELGVHVAHTLHRLYAPDFSIEKFGRLLMQPEIIASIQSGMASGRITDSWKSEEAAFLKRREPYLLYP